MLIQFEQHSDSIRTPFEDHFHTALTLKVPLLKRTKERSYNFISHAWVGVNTIAAITSVSDICIFNNGELVCHCKTTLSMR
jgi:hypothetical protein